MADNVAITAGSGVTIGADEVVDGTLGTVKVQYVKLMDGTLDGTSKAAVGANGLVVDIGIPTTCGVARKTVTSAGTPLQFTAQACKYVIITGLEANTDIVVIGSSGVVAAATGGGTTRTGIPLSPLQSIRLDISNVNILYIDSVVSGEGVSYTWFN